MKITVIIMMLLTAGILYTLKSCGSQVTPIEALEWFNVHHDELYKINSILAESPNIKRVDPGLSPKYASNKIRFTHREVDIYEKLVVESQRLGIRFIASYKEKATGKLITNTYTLDSTGMIGEGTAIRIEYVADANYVNNRNDKYNEEQYQKINNEGWYLVTYKSQKGVKY